jgi:hypothetical protein
LKFKDGFFIDYGKTSRETVQKYGEDVYRPEDLVPDEKALEEAAKLVDEEETDEFMAIADIAKLRVKGKCCLLRRDMIAAKAKLTCAPPLYFLQKAAQMPTPRRIRMTSTTTKSLEASLN